MISMHISNYEIEKGSSHIPHSKHAKTMMMIFSSILYLLAMFHWCLFYALNPHKILLKNELSEIFNPAYEYSTL